MSNINQGPKPRMKGLPTLLAILGFSLFILRCNNAGPVDITVLQVHLEDSLSIQAGKYDSIRIDLIDKDGKIWKEGIFSGPYDREKDKGELENIQVGEGAPNPLGVVISAYKGKVKQAEYRFQVTNQIAKVEPSTFIPPKDTTIVPIDTTKPKDTTTVPLPGRVTLSPRTMELFEGGDSAIITARTSLGDSGKEVVFKSSNEEVVMTAPGGHLFPKKVGQALVTAFLVGFPASGDTATITVKKDPPIIEAGTDRKVALDSAVQFQVKVTQQHGTVRILKWDLDGDGKYEDSAAKSEAALVHTYKNRGEFTVKLFARDSEGNETIKQLKIQAGILTPFILITNPGADTTVNIPSLLVEYTADGVKKTKQVSLKEGRNIVPITESNDFGIGGDTVVITLDTQAPGKPVFSAQLPQYSTNRRPTWLWSSNATDKGNGIFKVRLNSGEPKEGALLAYKPDIDLTDGANFLEIQERDTVGNWSAIATHTIYVDLTKPIVSIELPITSLRHATSASSILLSGSVVDVGGVSIVKYSTGSNQSVAEGTEKWKSGAVSLLDNSSTTIVVTAEDKAGNTGTDTLIVFCDKRGPGITITQPLEIGNFFTTASKHKVKGTAQDTSAIKLVTYALSGASTGEGDAVGTKDWSLPEITLRPGLTNLTIVAYDSLMNVSHLYLDFNYKANITLVDPTATGGNNGTSWKDAYRDLQTPLSKALIGEVWVAKGIYKPTTGADRTQSFPMQSGVHLFGGFKGGETSREDRSIEGNPTVLSGEIGGSVATDNSYHVVVGANYATLDGFTILGGYANDIQVEDNGKGAAIFANGTSPNIVNCVIKNNYSIGGGGMFLNNGYSQITNCIFSDNKARDDGGAILVVGSSSPVVLNSLFARNTSTNGGGAINNGANPLTIKNTLFFENSAPNGNNVSFSGVLNVHNSNADTTWDGGLMSWDGQPAALYGKKGYWLPVFQGPNDFKLKPGSPGIDEGMNDQDIPKFDITGAERPKGKQMDIGPYEQ